MMNKENTNQIRQLLKKAEAVRDSRMLFNDKYTVEAGLTEICDYVQQALDLLPCKTCDGTRGESDEVIQEVYVIGQDDSKGGYGMWHGPNPSLLEMLDVEGQDENSVITHFYPDGTHEVIYRWTCGEWMKIKVDENGKEC